MQYDFESAKSTIGQLMAVSWMGYKFLFSTMICIHYTLALQALIKIECTYAEIVMSYHYRKRNRILVVFTNQTKYALV